MPSDQPENDDSHDWGQASTLLMVMWYIATAGSSVTVAEISDGIAERLQNVLDTIDVVDEGDDTPIQQVWVLSGQDGIENRTDQLIREATDEVVLVIGDESLLTEDLVDSLNEVGNGANLIIGALTEPLENQIQTKVPDATTFITGLEWLRSENATKDETAIGRLLLIDQSTILVSSIMPGSKEEQAIFGEGFGNGLVVIARRLMAQGLLTAQDPGQGS